MAKPPVALDEQGHADRAHGEHAPAAPARRARDVMGARRAALLVAAPPALLAGGDAVARALALEVLLGAHAPSEPERPRGGVDQLGRRAVALARILRQRAGDDVVERGRQARDALGDARDGLDLVRVHGQQRPRMAERRRARHALGEDAAERVDRAAQARGLAAQLLGAAVLDAVEPVGRGAGRRGGARDREVGQPRGYLPAPVEHDRLWGESAVEHALRGRDLERRGDRREQPHRLLRGEHAAAQPGGQRPIREGRRVVDAAVVLERPAQRHECRMLERGAYAQQPHDGAQPLGVGRQRLADQRQRHARAVGRTRLEHGVAPVALGDDADHAVAADGPSGLAVSARGRRGLAAHPSSKKLPPEEGCAGAGAGADWAGAGAGARGGGRRRRGRRSGARRRRGDRGRRHHAAHRAARRRRGRGGHDPAAGDRRGGGLGRARDAQPGQAGDMAELRRRHRWQRRRHLAHRSRRRRRRGRVVQRRGGGERRTEQRRAGERDAERAAGSAHDGHRVGRLAPGRRHESVRLGAAPRRIVNVT